MDRSPDPFSPYRFLRYVGSAIHVLEAVMTGDSTNVVFCVSAGVALGAIAAVHSKKDKPTPSYMGLAAIAVATAVPLTTEIGPRYIYLIKFQGIWKSTSSILHDMLTPRGGMLITLCHAENPFTCEFENSYHMSPNHQNPLKGTAGRNSIVLENSCLLKAVINRGLIANRVNESFLVTVFQKQYEWVEVLTTAMSGINDRALFATCVGFFAGIAIIKFTIHSVPIGNNRFYENLEVLEKLPFYGKKWMLSVMACRACCFFIIAYISRKSLEERTNMFLAGGSSKHAEYALIIISDQLFWFGWVVLFQHLGLVPSLKTLCGWSKYMFPQYFVPKQTWDPPAGPSRAEAPEPSVQRNTRSNTRATEKRNARSRSRPRR